LAFLDSWYLSRTDNFSEKFWNDSNVFKTRKKGFWTPLVTFYAQLIGFLPGLERDWRDCWLGLPENIPFQKVLERCILHLKIMEDMI
jgi:hypothetical protein